MKSPLKNLLMRSHKHNHLLVLAASVAGISLLPLAGFAQTLVAHYDFESGAVTDLSGNGYNGTLNNSAQIIDNVNPAYGKVLDTYSTPNANTNAAMLGTWNPFDGGNSTFAAWIYLENYVNRDQVIVAKRDTWDLAQMMFGIQIRPNNFATVASQNHLVVNGGSVGGATYVESSVAIAEDAWTHVAVVFQNSQAQIYINGNTDNSGAFIPSTKTTANITLGNTRQDGIMANVNFSGQMDDVYFYSSALTQQQIQGLIPEPGVSWLVAVGGVALVLLRRCRRNRA